jgi:hypothetical protein
LLDSESDDPEDPEDPSKAKIKKQHAIFYITKKREE